MLILMINRVVIYLSFLAIGIMFGGTIIALHPSIISENTDVQMLFVQTAPSGTFEVKDGRQILTLSEISPYTIYFSDRPDRITGSMTTRNFFASWGGGNNSFDVDPPNAALEIFDNNENSNVFILELSSPVYSPTSGILQYDVIILQDTTDGLTQYDDRNDMEIPAIFDDAVLFIDSGDWTCYSLPSWTEIPC